MRSRFGLRRACELATAGMGRNHDVGDEPRMTFINRKHFAVGRGRLKPGSLNKTETAYAQQLELRKSAGEVLWYVFEGLKLRLADNTFYTPDFAVMLSDGSIECHEVKGFWEDAARVKIKVAADRFPFRFIAIKARAKRDGGGWAEEAFE